MIEAPDEELHYEELPPKKSRKLTIILSALLIGLLLLPLLLPLLITIFYPEYYFPEDPVIFQQTRPF